MIVTVKASNSERTLKEKHLLHTSPEAEIKLSHDDPTLSQLVQDAVKHFGEKPEDVQVIISMTW